MRPRWIAVLLRVLAPLLLADAVHAQEAPSLRLTPSTANVSGSATAPTAAALLRNEKFDELDRYYSSLQSRFRNGKASAEELRDAFRAFYPTDRDLAQRYDAWVKTHPKSYVARLARAIYYKQIAYQERGGEYISQTSDAQLAKMDEAMKKAIHDFGASIKMEPKPFLSYYNMIDVSRSYAGPEYARKMYERAIRLDPTFVGTRMKYMLSLEDKWGGSLEQMKSFFAECESEGLSQAQLSPLESMVYEDDGWEREQNDDLAGAESAYRKAIALSGGDCSKCLAISLSNVLVKENKTPDADLVISRYISGHPSDSAAIAWRASLYLKIRRVPEAVADLTTAASAGLPDAQNQLGVLYMTGVPDSMFFPDVPKGIQWLRKAAANGNVPAQHNLPMAEKLWANMQEAKEAARKRTDRTAGCTAPALHDPSSPQPSNCQGDGPGRSHP